MSHEDVQAAIDNNDPDAMDDSMAKQGLHINAAVMWDGASALHYAAMEGSEVCARRLIERRADINQQDRYGDTALMRAARNGHVGMVRLLLQAGADPRLKNKWGETALERAKANKHHEVVRLLVPCPAITARPPGRPSFFLHRSQGEGVDFSCLCLNASVQHMGVNRERWR